MSGGAFTTTFCEDFPPPKAIGRIKVLLNTTRAISASVTAFYTAVQNAPTLEAVRERADAFFCQSPAIDPRTFDDGSLNGHGLPAEVAMQAQPSGPANQLFRRQKEVVRGCPLRKNPQFLGPRRAKLATSTTDRAAPRQPFCRRRASTIEMFARVR